MTSNGTTTTTTQYFTAGPITAVAVNGALSYLLSDLLGSVTAALSTTGSVQAISLYGPYGTGLYSSGTMPTAKGFTGQYGDSATGLDYYGARYYDPLTATFISADTMQGPNRYAYVGGNPETRNDPSGRFYCVCGGGGDSGGPTPTPTLVDGPAATLSGIMPGETPIAPAATTDSTSSGGNWYDFLAPVSQLLQLDYLEGLREHFSTSSTKWEDAKNYAIGIGTDVLLIAPVLDVGDNNNSFRRRRMPVLR